ncbi:unnamed protein product [Pleuronectes platessa]|uniref:Uncharacterized protein n=1 Tax=Pleuronectes platessa TaxID=8262 RepID=A0A9N7VNE9_PLEPL|nr:unnamed protein product [Pleuronectes platessa]
MRGEEERRRGGEERKGERREERGERREERGERREERGEMRGGGEEERGERPDPPGTRPGDVIPGRNISGQGRRQRSRGGKMRNEKRYVPGRVLAESAEREQGWNNRGGRERQKQRATDLSAHLSV